MDGETSESERRRIVSLDDPADVTWWVEALGVPEAAIREAVARAGPGVEDVRRHLATHYTA